MTTPKTETALAIVDQPTATLAIARNPNDVLTEARGAAQALATVIRQKKNPVLINGQQYLEFEDWQTLGRFYDVTAKVVLTNYTEEFGGRGFEARAVAIDAKTGVELSAAESMCLDSEERWKDRELFQIKSMAQTRACAKALRNVLSWVAVLEGFAPTPAEELTGTEGSRLPPDARDQHGQERVALPGGVTTVLRVKRSKRNGRRGEFTSYMVTFSDGRAGSTIKDKLGERAEQLAGTGIHVIPAMTQNGKYWDLDDLDERAKPSEPSVAATKPEREPDVSEKVLTLRPTASGLTAVQGSEREYFVANESALLDDLKLIKQADGAATFDYEWKRRQSDSTWIRLLTGIRYADDTGGGEPLEAEDVFGG